MCPTYGICFLHLLTILFLTLFQSFCFSFFVFPLFPLFSNRYCNLPRVIHGARVKVKNVDGRCQVEIIYVCSFFPILECDDSREKSCDIQLFYVSMPRSVDRLKSSSCTSSSLYACQIVNNKSEHIRDSLIDFITEIVFIIFGNGFNTEN